VRSRRRHALLWLQQGGRLWLTQRPDSGVWASLWSLPEYESLDALVERLSVLPGEGEELPAVEHALTHFDWTLQPWRLALPAGDEVARAAAEALLPPGRWVTREEAFQMGLPAPVRRLLEREGE
jgi:A/G-specific adenine glycosylase